MGIKIGQKVRFDPLAETRGFGVEDYRGNYVTGTVVMVNARHKWFSVEYLSGSVKQRTSFKFCQIGEDVQICG